jgi:polysaccharide export outer membrane protein
MFLKKNLLIFLSAVMLMCSCGKHRYLQISRKVPKTDTLYLQSFEDYKVQVNDLLHIKVLTEKKEYADLVNASSLQQQTTMTSGPTLYLTGYSVDIEGNIEYPSIGKVHVAGLTVGEIGTLLHDKISGTIYDNQVVVRLISFRISIVGEVKNPGEYTVYRDQATIFQALALAGDANYYANRKDVIIYRKTPEGVIPHSIDLTKRDALSSSFYYLQPDDLVYIQPLPRTIFRVNISDIVTYLSAISSSLALVVAIISLSK